MTSALEVQNLSVAFETASGPKSILDNVSIALQPGEILGLIGESGSGKSMTALAVLDLLPRGAFKTGSISFGGIVQDVAGEFRRRGTVSTVFQNPMTALNPFLRVGRQIADVIALRSGKSFREAHASVKAVLEDVQLGGIRGIESRYPHELSGGQLQRILIGMALASNPSLLIADEPTTSLDVTTQAHILDLLVKRSKAQETAVLLITHDIGVVADRCDSITVMKSGRLVETGNVSEVLRSPQDPYTQTLLKDVPHLPMRLEDAQ